MDPINGDAKRVQGRVVALRLKSVIREPAMILFAINDGTVFIMIVIPLFLP
jgi:hypothetical protein